MTKKAGRRAFLAGVAASASTVPAIIQAVPVCSGLLCRKAAASSKAAVPAQIRPLRRANRNRRGRPGRQSAEPHQHLGIF